VVGDLPRHGFGFIARRIGHMPFPAEQQPPRLHVDHPERQRHAAGATLSACLPLLRFADYDRVRSGQSADLQRIGVIPA
jgi:hypothetical protein